MGRLIRMLLILPLNCPNRRLWSSLQQLKFQVSLKRDSIEPSMLLLIILTAEHE